MRSPEWVRALLSSSSQTNERASQLYDAKTRLSQLVERAEAGEEIIIARGGRPAARLVPFRVEGVKRKPGRMRGRIRIGSDFDAPLPGNLFDPDE